MKVYFVNNEGQLVQEVFERDMYQIHVDEFSHDSRTFKTHHLEIFKFCWTDEDWEGDRSGREEYIIASSTRREAMFILKTMLRSSLDIVAGGEFPKDMPDNKVKLELEKQLGIMLMTKFRYKIKFKREEHYIPWLDRVTLSI